MDLRKIIDANLGSACSHEQVCKAIHRALKPETPASDYYCCRSTGSLCEAIYDGFYDGIATGDRSEAVLDAVERWKGQHATSS